MNTLRTPHLLVAALVAASASVVAKPNNPLKDSEHFSGFSVTLGASQVTQSGRSFI